MWSILHKAIYTQQATGHRICSHVHHGKAFPWISAKMLTTMLPVFRLLQAMRIASCATGIA